MIHLKSSSILQQSLNTSSATVLKVENQYVRPQIYVEKQKLDKNKEDTGLCFYFFKKKYYFLCF